MREVRERVDVLVAGGGTAGHIAAVQAARAGTLTSVIEADSMLGGSMTVGGIYTPCFFFGSDGQVVLGIPWELFCKSKEIEGLPLPDPRKRRPVETPGFYTYINVPVYAALAEEEAIKAGVILHYHEFVADVCSVGNEWEVTSLGRGIRRVTRCREIIDCTGDADVVRALDLPVYKGPERQPGAYAYKIEGIEYEQIWEKEAQTLFEEAMENGLIRKGDYAFPNWAPFMFYLTQGGHECTHVYDADTSDADGQTRANIEGRARMLRMYKFLREWIPGCERAAIKAIAYRALSRETYCIVGEYTVTRDDFLSARSYEDNVCNAFNYIDMHSEQGCDVVFHETRDMIPKVPFRALIPKGSARITVAGRIVSADRWALAGIRAQCTCMAMGQAVGAAAALAVKRGIASREVPVKDIVALTVEHGAVPV